MKTRMNMKRRNKKSPREMNEDGKKLVSKRLREITGLGQDTLKIWTSATNGSSELLCTSADCQKTALLYVRFSRSYRKDFECKTSGWHSVTRKALEQTQADFWVFVCVPTRGKPTPANCDYVIINPKVLSDRLQAIDPNGKTWHIYLTHCGDNIVDRRPRNSGNNDPTLKDYTEFLNNWKSVEEFLNRKTSPNPNAG